MADKKTQIQKFRETARAIEADESEERFDDALKKVTTSSGEARAVVHASDCALHDAPAYQLGHAPVVRLKPSDNSAFHYAVIWIVTRTAAYESRPVVGSVSDSVASE